MKCAAERGGCSYVADGCREAPELHNKSNTHNVIIQHNNIMKAFCLVALVPLVACNADADAQFTAFTAFGSHASHAVAHHAAHHAARVVHHTAHHAIVHQGYEQPKHNCSVLDVVEIADVCTPALDTVCTPHELSRKSIKDVEQCYTVTRTVCTESTCSTKSRLVPCSLQPLQSSPQLSHHLATMNHYSFLSLSKYTFQTLEAKFLDD